MIRSRVLCQQFLRDIVKKDTTKEGQNLNCSSSSFSAAKNYCNGKFNISRWGGRNYFSSLSSSSSSSVGGSALRNSQLVDFRNNDRRYFHATNPTAEVSSSSTTATSDANNTSQQQQQPYEESAEDKAKTEKLKRTTRYAFYALGGSFVATIFGSILAYGKPPRNPEDGEIMRDEFSDLPLLKQYLSRTWNEYLLWYYYIVEPSSEKLLPDPLPAPYYQPRYTLVLELNGVLIHPEWSYATGWRFKKRPALDKFVQDVGYPHFEVVIYTNEQGAIAHPLLDNIDPEWRFMHRLYRDATKYMKHVHVKDLSKLNRDLSKVILVDWDSQAFQLNPENALRIPKWQGDDEDRGLIDLASLLLMIADSNVDDVRPVVQYYSQFDDPINSYVENRKKMLEEKMHKMEQKKDHPQESLTKNFAGRLFGYRRHTSS